MCRFIANSSRRLSSNTMFSITSIGMDTNMQIPNTDVLMYALSKL